MITFNTIDSVMVDPITDLFLQRSDSLKFQELDSRVFLNLVLAGKEVSVENILSPETEGCGEGNGYGKITEMLGYGQGEASGFGAPTEYSREEFSGKGIMKYFSREGKPVNHSRGFSPGGGNGSGEGSSIFPRHVCFWFYRPEYDWITLTLQRGFERE